jgi:hypothetical protein
MSRKAWVFWIGNYFFLVIVVGWTLIRREMVHRELELIQESLRYTFLPMIWR